MTIEYKIYCDLDGVLVDFITKAVAIAGFSPEAKKGEPAEKLLRRDFWKAIEKHVKAGKPFFADMDPLPDAMTLWDYIKPHDPIICSATGHVIGATGEKREWVRRHLGHETANGAKLVRDAKMKAQFAAPSHILIDDRHKAIDPWVEAGGIGILHTSAISTIAQLKELGL